MRPPHLSILIILTQSAAFISATSSPIQALLPRSQHCANAPTTIAGTALHPRSPPPLRTRLRRARGTVWCTPGSSTFVVITTSAASSTLPSLLIPDLLVTATGTLLAHIQHLGDGVMPALPQGPIFQWLGQHSLALEVSNANNHQTTYGVLAAALVALWQYMAATGDVERASFDVFDGANLVGMGWVG